MSDTLRPTTIDHTSVHLFDDSAVEAAYVLNRALWDAAQTLDEYIATATQHQDLWHATRRIARVSDHAIAQSTALRGPVALLVLTEDWCGDAIHTLPYLARLVEANSALSMRLVSRDAHNDLMSAHLTGHSRSIPVVIAFDANDTERGWWGPRPSPLQQWVKRDGVHMEKGARYKAIRTWYARDRGETTVQELLMLLAHTDRERVVLSSTP